MAGSFGVQLITNGTASSSLVDCPGGRLVFAVVATFNGATIKLQTLGPDGTSLVDVGAATTLTANGAGVADLPPCQVQATVVGGPPSGVYASVARVIS